jgi:hypothetical protein
MPDQIHVSYLVRLWRPNTRSSWHVMVVNVARPDEHQHFATLDALFAFLTTQTNSVLAVQQMSMQTECEQDHYTTGGVAREEPL